MLYGEGLQYSAGIELTANLLENCLDAYRSEVCGIDESNWIVRAYFEGSMKHGFFRVPNELLETFDFSGISSTVPFATDDNGEISGWYLDDSGAPLKYGPVFVRDIHIRFALMSFPDSDYMQIYAIADDGEVFGTYFSGNLHGPGPSEISVLPRIDTLAAVPEPRSITLLAIAGGITLLAASARNPQPARRLGVRR